MTSARAAWPDISPNIAPDPAPLGTAAPGTAFDRWFAGSRIVGAEGAPLPVYHGTTADFSVFVAHAPVAVFRLDGIEITRLDSWDVEGETAGMVGTADWSRRPEGFHYGALSDALSLGAEAALAMRTAEAARMLPRDMADPSDDTARRLADLRRLVGHALTQTTESRPSGDGHYFTPDPAYSYVRDIGHHPGGRVLPVYLSIRNPVYLNASQIESAGTAWRVAQYRAQGYDGAVFTQNLQDLTRRGWHGATQIVAFDAHQIKSVFNLGTFDPATPDIRFRRDDAQPLPAPPKVFTLPLPFGSSTLARHGVRASGPRPAAPLSSAVPQGGARAVGGPANELALSEQAAQRAAAFAAWFGESAVRRPDGLPRILFHGTTADFTVFRAAAGTAADPGWYGTGIYLTADPETASAYAGDIAADSVAGTDAQGAGAPRVIAVYVALQAPYVWPAERPAATTPEAARAIRAELEAAGHDGVVVPNRYAEGDAAAHWEVVAFSASQVKSVYNVGTFDAREDDLRYARGAAVLPEAGAGGGADAGLADVGTQRTDTRAFRDWFGASRVTRDGAPQVVYHGRTSDFARFDLTRAGEFGDRFADAAFFTSSPRVASGYAVRLMRNAEFAAVIEELDASRQRWASSAVEDGVNSARYRAVKAAHDAVNARREAIAASLHTFEAPSTGANVMAAYLSLQDPLEVDAGGQLYFRDRVTGNAIDQAIAEGRDGVIVRNVLDFASAETREPADVFVVFDAVNIKSVYNFGSFSRSDDDIRFARSRTSLAERRARQAALTMWQGDSVLREADGSASVFYHGSHAALTTVSGELFWVTPGRELAETLNGGRRRATAVHVKSARPFEPMNAAHVALVAEAFDARFRHSSFSDWRRRLHHWKIWDDAFARRIVQQAGFDAIWSEEDGVPTLGLIGPVAGRVKLAEGRALAYDPEVADIRFARGRTAALAGEGGSGARKQGALRDADADFDAWFAGSKAVDRDGQPLTLYHGTPQDFDTFDPKHARENGFFFTVDPEHAEMYAGPKGALMPVHLAIRNPMRVEGWQLPPRASKTLIKQMIADAKEAGHDGVIVERFRDHVWGTSDTYIAFEPTQIKSVFNIGSYDAENPDIRFSRTHTATLAQQATAEIAHEDPEADHLAQLERTGYWGREGAGCLIMARDTGRILWPKCSAYVQEPGTYGTWGGAIDGKEPPRCAVQRELREETGYFGEAQLVPLLVFDAPGFRYHNFLAVVPREFSADLNWETEAAEWRAMGDWPEPLHPGAKVLLADAPSMATMRARSHDAAFAAWFQDSKVLDATGQPAIYYHGTRSDFSIFRGNDKGLIFVSSSAAQAGEFARAREGSALMPLYVSVQRPFDPEKSDQIDSVVANLDFDIAVQEATELSQSPWTADEVERWLREGQWQILELPCVLQILREQGFDGIYLNEMGVRNLAVFSPNQLKSATGNLGTYEAENPDIRFSRSPAAPLPQSDIRFARTATQPLQYEPHSASRVTPPSDDSYEP
ncbi:MULTISPECIES: ADP-ribosyltransferase-containing protein [Cupriavidus]